MTDDGWTPGSPGFPRSLPEGAGVTDQELLAKASAARGLAHRAPFGEWSKDHRGHSSIVNHTRAWAARGDELMAYADELERRGLKLPPCDCPLGSHDWEITSTVTGRDGK